MKTFLGDLFYKYTEESDNLETLRIIKFKNENTIIVKDTITGVKRIISRTVLEKEYTRLKPDASVAFSIVQLECNVKDVIVAMYRRDDLE
ncbi:MAG: hypothetical protein ACRDD7_09160, partial [Peptostreptococcaceae bacterium]